MRRRAFTLTEILIAVIVVGIVGGSVIAALSSFFLSYAHTEDYTVAREEIENAFQMLSAQIGNAGLGMPNNREGQGSFAVAFSASGSAPKASVMSLMGKKGEGWGGPVTVAKGDIAEEANRVTAPDADGNYSGSELYYAWSAPSGTLIQSVRNKTMSKPKKAPHPQPQYEHYDILSEDMGYWTGEEVHLKPLKPGGGALASKDAWIALPSFGAPLWVKESTPGQVIAQVAPGAVTPKVLLGGMILGYEEVHRVRAARLRVDSGNLIQELFDTPPQAAPSRTRVLARHVVGTWFRFNPETRILQFSLAVRGLNATDARIASGKRPPGWPDGAPDIEDEQHRIMVENMTWRVRN